MAYSYQQAAAPLQKFAKSYDTGQNSQYNGQFSQMNPMTPRPAPYNQGPMKQSDYGRGYGSVQRLPTIPRPIPQHPTFAPPSDERGGYGGSPFPSPRPNPYNQGPMKPPGGEDGPFDGQSMQQQWMQDPRIMQWLMSMFGGQSSNRGWM